MNAAFTDHATGTMFLAGYTGAVTGFEAGSIAPGRWRSKRFAFPEAIGFGWMRVSGPITDPVTVRLYVDDALIHTATLTTRDPARVPAVKGMRWEIEIESVSQVTEVCLAQTQPELFA